MSSPPTTLGKYQIIREIARSNDIVYEAYDPLMNRRVAVKELSMPNGSTPQQREERISRFKREARAAGTLAHPNIMTVYELGEEGDRFFIAMEYLDGCSLRNELDAKGSIPLDRAIEIEIAILKGLEFAHSKGVIHRDIKPDNIQLLSDGRIKLTDFGIARLTFEPNLTMDGQVFGTPSYMSPEQVVGKDIDARSDIFSAGIVFYEMLGGRKPFPGDSVVSITYAIMNKEPERLNEANFLLWQVIERSLDKSPALRFSSAAEMVTAIEQAQASANAGPVLDPNPAYVHSTYSTGSYNPYGANPYVTNGPPPLTGMPQVNAPTPPPVMYTYNPYTPTASALGGPINPGYGSHSPTQHNMSPSVMNSQYVPNPTGLPVYYPPPPRQPLMSAETKQFWGRFLLAFLVFGTLIGVGLLVVNSVSTSINRTSEVEHDQEVVAEVSHDVQNLSPRDQLNRIEEIRPELKSEIGKEEAKDLEGAVQRKQGEAFFQTRDYADAEASFNCAIELNPDDVTAHRDLAGVYEAIAEDRAYAQQSMMFWNKSVQSYLTAASVERDPNRQRQFANDAAKASVAYAGKLIQAGDMLTAEQSLERVKGLAMKGSVTEAAVSRLMAQIRSTKN